MAKGNRGLPSDYRLTVPEGLKPGPVQLDDYLDDTTRPFASARPAPVRKSHETTASEEVTDEAVSWPTQQKDNIVHMPPASESFSEVLRSESRPPSPEPPTIIPEPRGAKPPPRKQFNMTPDTLRMVDELLATIQRYSGQKDAKASEMFHALVSALYEARDLLDLQNIPSRGRWGTSTARAFPVHLKNAFQAAIYDFYRRRRS